MVRLRGENAKSEQARSLVIAGELAAIIERRRQARMVRRLDESGVPSRRGVRSGISQVLGEACFKAGRRQM